MKLKPNWKYWTTDCPFIEGRSVLHDEPLPNELIGVASFVFTDKNGAIVQPSITAVIPAPGVRDNSD